MLSSYILAYSSNSSRPGKSQNSIYSRFALICTCFHVYLYYVMLICTCFYVYLCYLMLIYTSQLPTKIIDFEASEALTPFSLFWQACNQPQIRRQKGPQMDNFGRLATSCPFSDPRGTFDVDAREGIRRGFGEHSTWISRKNT